MPGIKSSLKRKLKKADTIEKCGLILRDGTILDVENIYPDPTEGFQIPAKDMIDNEDQMVATWHTHPGKTANLSEMDYNGFKQWPTLTHYVIGTDKVREFVVDGELVVEK